MYGPANIAGATIEEEQYDLRPNKSQVPTRPIVRSGAKTRLLPSVLTSPQNGRSRFLKSEQKRTNWLREFANLTIRALLK